MIIFIYVPTNTSKETKEKINFDELPKKNSRIKIITKKNMKFETKALNFAL